MNKRKNINDVLDETEKMSTKELIERTQAVEDEKERKRNERLAKKAERERKRHQAKMEKLVAPFLLVVTIIISLVVKFFGNL